jgi:hypothetical protein
VKERKNTDAKEENVSQEMMLLQNIAAHYV